MRQYDVSRMPHLSETFTCRRLHTALHNFLTSRCQLSSHRRVCALLIHEPTLSC